MTPPGYKNTRRVSLIPKRGAAVASLSSPEGHEGGCLMVNPVHPVLSSLCKRRVRSQFYPKPRQWRHKQIWRRCPFYKIDLRGPWGSTVHLDVSDILPLDVVSATCSGGFTIDEALQLQGIIQETASQEIRWNGGSLAFRTTVVDSPAGSLALLAQPTSLKLTRPIVAIDGLPFAIQSGLAVGVPPLARAPSIRITFSDGSKQLITTNQYIAGTALEKTVVPSVKIATMTQVTPKIFVCGLLFRANYHFRLSGKLRIDPQPETIVSTPSLGPAQELPDLGLLVSAFFSLRLTFAETPSRISISGF